MVGKEEGPWRRRRRRNVARRRGSRRAESNNAERWCSMVVSSYRIDECPKPRSNTSTSNGTRCRGYNGKIAML